MCNNRSRVPRRLIVRPVPDKDAVLYKNGMTTAAARSFETYDRGLYSTTTRSTAKNSFEFGNCRPYLTGRETIVIITTDLHVRNCYPRLR